ncbi:MAG: DMT family transporter [Betaproteobacteria bacterium]|nr:DMT family transporter [Betaproteobacteria bacterium]
MIAAMALFAAMDAINKTLTQDYAIAQIMTIRFVLFVAIACAVARRGPWLVLETRAPWWQALRSAVLLLEMICFVLAFRYLPLADVHAVAAAAPLLATALAAFFLRERVDALGWGLVAGGMVGAALVVGPAFDSFGPAMWLAVAATFFWGLYQVITRRVAALDHADITTLHTPLAGLAILGALAVFDWRAPDAMGWLLLVSGGFMGALAHLLLIRALSAAPASELQPYNYFLLVFAALLGAVAYGDIPGPWTWLGAAVVVLCGVVAMRRQTRT